MPLKVWLKRFVMNEASKRKVYLLGDSITQGLGSKKVNFTNELSRLLGDGFEIVNLAYTGTTIDYALGLLNQGKVEPGDGSMCVILYGNVDAQIRPSRTGKVFPKIPKRFQGGGMLMPRPFYSRKLSKHAGQLVDNVARKILSALIKVVDGTEQWVSIESFNEQYGLLLDNLREMGVKAVACSCVYIDEKLFPGTQAEYMLFNESIYANADRRGVPYLDLWTMFESEVELYGWAHAYNKDHFHPNGFGYGLMAERIARALDCEYN